MSEQAAQAARKAFALRLKDLRLDARLNGRQLAAATGMLPSKISRIEHARQNPTEDDIRTWCRACSAEAQIPELIAAHREVEQMWLEHRRELRAGFKHQSERNRPLYEQSTLIQVYEPMAIPGFLQARHYIRASLDPIARFHGMRDDLDTAVEGRLNRLRVLTSGITRFSFVVEATALYTVFGDQETMEAQYDFLITATRLPNVSLGIIPLGRTRKDMWPNGGFYIYDDRLVRCEQWTGLYQTERPEEIATFLKIFRLLREQAVLGDAARAEIDAARTYLQSRETS